MKLCNAAPGGQQHTGNEVVHAGIQQRCEHLPSLAEHATGVPDSVLRR